MICFTWRSFEGMYMTINNFDVFIKIQDDQYLTFISTHFACPAPATVSHSQYPKQGIVSRDVKM
jgi:hypothetical protein